MKMYYVYPNDRCYTIIDKGHPVTMKEVRRIIREDAAKARKHFGTAVIHYHACSATITARKDIHSALWGRWTFLPSEVNL